MKGCDVFRMSRSAEKLFTKALHLSDPWEVFSVNIDDTETGVDIRIRSKGRVDHICPIAGAHAKAMKNAKGPGSTWISSIWNVISIVRSHVCSVRNARR